MRDSGRQGLAGSGFHSRRSVHTPRIRTPCLPPAKSPSAPPSAWPVSSPAPDWTDAGASYVLHLLGF